VTSKSTILDQPRADAPTESSRDAHRWLGWLFWSAAIGILLYQLGDAGLFDPDEGRNSEKAREILVLNDWVTPHENFHPVLDKPMFFYWLIVISYKLFGVTEWSARLPSALAAFGCLILVYRFADRRWGRWEALWSALILLTCVQFFVLARIVILDMPLTFFLTWALCAVYEAVHADEVKSRRLWCLALYVSLGAATLIKGLIGVVLPGMILVLYLLLTRRWSILRRISLIPGVLIFLAIVLPWYLQADARHVGYLRYFIWDEHFGRFTSENFDRAEPWYYFILVGLVGFFPWTLLLPFVVREYLKKSLDDKTLFLVLWVGLPFVFFSASESKLAHYLLPIFPALSILTAAALMTLWRKTETVSLAFSLIWSAQSLAILYLVTGAIIPAILPEPIRASVSALSRFFWLYGAFLVLSLACLSVTQAARRLPTRRQLYAVHGVVMVLFLAFVVEIMFLVSHDRSARPVAEKALSQIHETTQLVFYDTHLPGMPFYLHAERPIWLVTHGDKKRTFLGHYYEVAERKDLTTPWGDAIFDFDEFREKWHTAKEPLLVVVKEKNLMRLARNVGDVPKKLVEIDGYALVTKQ
jgi:4-amino-4-deoxy-L-arabinose transferase-like glycosyltransferase